MKFYYFYNFPQQYYIFITEYYFRWKWVNYFFGPNAPSVTIQTGDISERMLHTAIYQSYLVKCLSREFSYTHVLQTRIFQRNDGLYIQSAKSYTPKDFSGLFRP